MRPLAAPSAPAATSAATPLVAPPPDEHDAARLTRTVAALPDRLLLLLLWACVTVAVATVLGQHRPVVVVPLFLVVAAVTWRWRPAPVAPARHGAVAAAVALAFAVMWVVVQLPLTGERLIISRDPDVYTLTSLWLVDHPSPAVPIPEGTRGGLGFFEEDGALRPQGAHLVPALSAVFGWVAGTPGVLAANLVWGAFGLLALFTLGRRVVGPSWALVPPAALALSLPMLDFSRSMYSEPLSMALTLLGTALLLDAWRSGRARDFVLAGAALGAVALARIDGTLISIGVVAGLTLLAVSVPGGTAGSRRWGSPLVAAATFALAALGLLDVYLYSGVYFNNQLVQVAPLLGVGVAAALAATVLAWLAHPRSPRVVAWQRVVRRLAPAAGVLLVVVWAFLASRTYWYVGRAVDVNDTVVALQTEAGVPVDGTRRYYEDAIAWLTWYYGFAPVVLGLLVFAAWLAWGLRDPRRGALACLLLVVLPSSLLYFYEARITPDHVWAVRRFLPVVVPGLLLATVWGARALASASGPARAVRRWLAGLVAVALIAWPLGTLPGLWFVRDKGGVLAGMQQVCDAVDGRPTVVTGVDTFLPSVIIFCGVPAYGLREPTPQGLAEAYRALAGPDGGEVALVTRDPAGLAWPQEPPAPIDVIWSAWKSTLFERPSEAIRQGTLITVGSVEPDGSVSAG
jgi:hypothetical protein